MELMTYRGHIRNWQELCQTLELDETLSRREREEAILLAGYEKWGYELPKHIYGMFAFAIKDGDKLYLVRDQFGTKPMYYYVTDKNTLLYGTMIRDFMDDPDFHKELNRDMLQIYLSLTYAAGENTFFKGVKKVMPGHYVVFENGQLTITRYWNPEFHPDKEKTLDAWADEIYSTVADIFKQVKTPDEEAGSFLSSGVDSSFVMAMSDVKTTYSCGYDDQRFDESPLAKVTADQFGRGFSRCLITPERYFDVVPFTMYNMEQPLGDASAISFTIACLETAKDVKICYSGEGADEFFGGYNMYRNAERYGDNLRNFYVGNTNIMKEDDKKKILKYYKEDYLPINMVQKDYDEMEGLDPLSKMSLIDIKVWLDGDIYLNVDKMSTAAGLEIRMPLTDLRVFDIASRLPSCYKVNDTQNKVALRTAAAKVLPEEVAFRKKLGFIVPIRMWLADDRYNGDVKRLFNSDIAEEFFDVQAINQIFDDYVNVNSDLWRIVWTIYVFLVWYEEYFVKR